MCGIAGFWLRGRTLDDPLETLRQMARSLHHRGPDDQGVSFDPGAGVGLAHRRLSIVDLSPQGHQPKCSLSGRFELVFNGEIYNHLEIRRELGEGVAFRGHSDTETMLAAFDAWGVQGALRRFNGMFAFGLFDRQQNTLQLVRDRLGIKPLYVAFVKGAVLFASELASLQAFPGFAPALDPDAMTLFLEHGHIPAPHTVYRDVHKLRPGTLWTLKAEGQGSPQHFWSLRDALSQPPVDMGDAQALETLDALLVDAVSLRMMSDVPLGAFLSGGVDSSLVVALMQERAARPVKTFSIGFEDARFDEAPFARDVARHLGSDHTELYVSDKDAQDVVPGQPDLFSEPFGDASWIPTLLVSKLAREHVTVSLSGDGGDELFHGYDMYAAVAAHWKRLSAVPTSLRCAPGRTARAGLRAALRHAVAGGGAWLDSLFWADRRLSYLAAQDFGSLYHSCHARFLSPRLLIPAGRSPSTPLSDPLRWEAGHTPDRHLFHVDVAQYLPSDILTKVDRASMAVSLESRVPLLDHRVVELAARLPLDLKLRDGQRKWLLRQVLYRRVPKHLIERPKRGFSVPLARWLRGPLRGWAESLIHGSALRHDDLLDKPAVKGLWGAFFNHNASLETTIWYILTYLSWRSRARGR